MRNGSVLLHGEVNFVDEEEVAEFDLGAEDHRGEYKTRILEREFRELADEEW